MASTALFSCSTFLASLFPAIQRALRHLAPSILARSVVSARNCNCFTAPSVLRISLATSFMLFSSTNRSTTTRRCSAGKPSTMRNNIAFRSTSSSSAPFAATDSICSGSRPLARASFFASGPKSSWQQCETTRPQTESRATRTLQVSQSVMKNLGGQILGFRADLPPAGQHTHTPARNDSRKAPQSAQDPSAPPRPEAARPLLS